MIELSSGHLWGDHFVGVAGGAIFGMAGGGAYGLFNGSILSRTMHGALFGASLGSIGSAGLGIASRLTMFAGKQIIHTRAEKKGKLIAELRAEKESICPRQIDEKPISSTFKAKK